MRFRRVVVCTAIPLLGIWTLAISPPASARPAPKKNDASVASQSRTKSVAGTYAYSDSFGVTDEPLVISAGGTVALGSSCTGLWVQSGTIFTMDIDANCSVTVGSTVYTLTAIFSG